LACDPSNIKIADKDTIEYKVLTAKINAEIVNFFIVSLSVYCDD